MSKPRTVMAQRLSFFPEVPNQPAPAPSEGAENVDKGTGVIAIVLSPG